MNVCEKNRKNLSWLAIGALEPRAAGPLRAHVAACPGCRRYLREISCVAADLSTAGSEGPETVASDAFHRGLARRIAEERRSGLWTAMQGWPRIQGFSGRVFAPTVGLAILGLACLLLVESRPKHQPVLNTVEPMAATISAGSEMPPTLEDYRILANQSTDALDHELTKEARTSYTSAPAYKASSSWLAGTTDGTL